MTTIKQKLGVQNKKELDLIKKIYILFVMLMAFIDRFFEWSIFLVTEYVFWHMNRIRYAG